MNIKIKHYDELTKDELFNIFKLRVDVFVVEQKCPYEEIDEYDKKSYHLMMEENGNLISYLRIIPKGIKENNAVIGRVITKVRRQGNGTKILKDAMDYIKNNLKNNVITLEAQVYARSLYEKVGFIKISEEFLEDGIPHVKMELNLK